MRLSEAIRLGAMLHPQAFQALAERWPQPPRCTIPWGGRTGIRATCALGAAGVAALGEAAFCNIERAFPILRAEVTAPDGLVEPLDLAITRLNDLHRWTREEIADWVEQVERDHDAQTDTEEVGVLSAAQV